MSLMLQDKIEAVYELKRFSTRRVQRSHQQLTERVNTLLRHVLNENRRLTLHLLETQMTLEERRLVLDNCPTLARWVQL